ncbi:restriction endonuclease subunit S [Halomonas sp. A11-A]|uniref:restriction endonuclease subunit S n=1 Tax=Halomonas sp. A11-A TaxID=2183985 RepID=UPI001C63EEC7|nr:restriction endonuclease subunit S [Halomonas sp. A11-A]
MSTTLGELCELNPKQKLDDELEVGFMPMSGVPTIFHEKPEFETRKWEAVKKGYTQFKDGDVLFAKITPCFENGKATVVEGFPCGWGAGSTEYHVLRPRAEAVDPRLLLALVRTKDFLNSGELNMSGSVGHKRVPKEFVADYTFPLMSAEEQKVIADKLDELLAQVNNLKARLDAIPAILKRFRKSVLAAAVSGRLIEGQSPYEVIAIGEISELVTKGASPKWQGVSYTDDPTQTMFVTSENVGSMELLLSSPKYVEDEFNKKQARSLLAENDVLTNIVGASIGRSAVWRKQEKANINQAVCLIRLDSKRCLPRFLEIFLNSPHGVEALVGNRVDVARANISLAAVKEIKINLPSVNAQHGIVRRVDQLFAFADQIEQQVANAQARVDKLTQSILAKAFRGELTAEWRAAHPELISGEHSAAALLERIKAEKAKQTPAGRGRKKAATETTGSSSFS